MPEIQPPDIPINRPPDIPIKRPSSSNLLLDFASSLESGASKGIDAVSNFLSRHPTLREAGQRLLTGSSPEFEQSLKNRGVSRVLGTPESESSILPEWKSQPETYTGGFLKSLYGDYVRPLGTPSGIISSSGPRELIINHAPKDFVGKSTEVPYSGSVVAKDTPKVDIPTSQAELPIRKPSISDSLEADLKPIKPKDIPIEEASKPNEKPTAIFRGMQESPDGPSLPLYDVKGGKYDGSTVSADTLTKEGIEVPPASQEKLASQSLEDYFDYLDKQLGQTSDTPSLQMPFDSIDLAPKTSKPFVSPFSKPEEPQAARTSEGKLAIGADVKSLGKVLGTSLYKGDIAPIATKELLQNSVDAVRHLGSEGKIDVWLNQGDHFIQVTDNGKGLTKDELETVFTDLGSSGKRNDESAVGGFGLAKAAPLLGGKSVEVSSVARDVRTGKLIESSFSGTPNDLLEGVNIIQKPVPEGTPTGTRVRTYVDKNADMYGAKSFVSELSENSPGLDSKVNLYSNYEKGLKAPKDYHRDSLPANENRKHIATISSPSADVELSVPSSAIYRHAAHTTLKLSNNGMYQSEVGHYLSREAPNFPSKINVDVRSKVPEGHSNYPFTANRENLRGTTEEVVKKYIEDNIVKPSTENRMRELKELYETMPKITVGQGKFPNIFGRKISIYDPGGRFTPNELKTITSDPSFHNLASVIGQTIDDTLKVVNNPAWRDRLEKTGIIFQDGLHGIHIPNPNSGKSAILINPFISIGEMTPDEASANILHTILHESAHIEHSDPGHNEAFTIRLGDIYAKFGAKRSVTAQDLIQQAITDSSGEYSQPIQKILQQYKESRGRPETTPDLLSGTGIKSAVKSGGETDIPGSSKSTGERTVKASVDKLFRSILEAKGSVNEQEAINKATRAKRFAAFEGTSGEGEDWFKKASSKMKGEYEKVSLPEGSQLAKEDVDNLYTALKNNKSLSVPEKLRAGFTLTKLMNGEVPQRAELRLLDNVFGDDFSQGIINMHGGLGAIGGQIGATLAKLDNTAKAAMTTIHLSGPLRQGIGFIHTPEWRAASADMFRFMKNKEFYDASMQTMREDPVWNLARDAGMRFPDSGKLTNADDMFARNFITDLPSGIKGGYIKDLNEVSKRGFNGFLTKLRFDIFKSMLQDAKDLGHEVYNVATDSESGSKAITPTDAAKNIARFVNYASGTGGLGAAERFAGPLSRIFWSPRLMTSRIGMLTNPTIYTSLPAGMRREGIKSLFAIAGLGSTVSALSALAGAKLSRDITSSDFMKARFSNQVLDSFGGFQQPVVAAARMIDSVNKTGSLSKSADIAGRYLANKETPLVSLAHELVEARKFTGGGNFTDQFGNKKTIPIEAVKRFTPIFVQDFSDLLKSDPTFAETLGLGTANLFGMGLQDYPERSQGKLRLSNKLRF